MEPTPEGRLAAIAREECYKRYDSVVSRSPLRRNYPPDYADFLAAFDVAVKEIVLNAKLEEARLKPANDARIKELLMQLAETVERKTK